MYYAPQEFAQDPLVLDALTWKWTHYARNLYIVFNILPLLLFSLCFLFSTYNDGKGIASPGSDKTLALQTSGWVVDVGAVMLGVGGCWRLRRILQYGWRNAIDNNEDGIYDEDETNIFVHRILGHVMSLSISLLPGMLNTRGVSSFND